MSLKEQQEIVDEYMKKDYQQKEIARRFRVKVQLVRDLVRESKNNPEKMIEAKKREKKAAQKQTAIVNEVNKLKQ